MTVSKQCSDRFEDIVALVMDERARTLARFSFPNDRLGYDHFHRRLEQLRQHHQAPEVLVAMEPTNYFWKLLAAELEREARPYRLVNAYTVKKHRDLLRSLNRRDKLTIVMVTHDDAQARKADALVRLAEGKVQEIG